MNSSILLLASVATIVASAPAAAQQVQTGSPTQPTAPVAPTPRSPAAVPPATVPATPGPSVARPTATAPPPARSSSSAGEDLGDEEDIVITGSRARGSVVGDIPPENTLQARDIRATGATNINDLLDALAPQIGSVRGRGGEAPVLLLNGERISSFRELRDIPTEAIVRVEILPEEVALKYGYTADQKVVNIVLRQRFRSTTAQIGAGAATDGGYANANGDLTRFLVQRNGRTTINLHAEGNSMLTEAERNIPLTGTATEQDLAARSLVGTKRDIRAGSTFNRQVFGNVSATLNTELEHNEGLSFIALNPNLLEPLERNTATNTAHAGVTVSGQTKKQWHWNVTGNADYADTLTNSDQANVSFPRDRANETTKSGNVAGNLNGNLFKLPGGYATTTLTLGGTSEHLKGDGRRVDQKTGREVLTSSNLSRTTGQAKINVDIPISHKSHDFSALGNLTVNGNAEVDQLSDFGTLTRLGAGVNLTPVDRLNLLASWTREEGPPTINQLGDPVIDTSGSRVFDFATGQTVLVNVITGGNPNLTSNRRNVVKLSGNWQPWQNTDLRFRVDYVHQTIAGPISSLSVTPALEAAFPNRFVRAAPLPGQTIGQLISVDLTPVNFDSSTRDQLRIGFDFSHPLKSRQPSQAIIDQMRQRFGFGPRGTQGGPGGAPGAGAGSGTPGGGGFRGEGGFRGGRGGGGFFGGGGSRGRVMFDLTDTITFVDKVQVAPGGPTLDYLHGDAVGATGGSPRHNVQAQLTYFNNGLGARLASNWRSGTKVNSLNGNDLHFSSYGTFDLRLFANPGDIPEVVVKHPWLRGTQFQLNITNVFNARPQVRDATGNVPLNYEPDLLDPLGRTVMITFRKLFLPSPAWFRRQFQLERQQQQQQGTSSTR